MEGIPGSRSGGAGVSFFRSSIRVKRRRGHLVQRGLLRAGLVSLAFVLATGLAAPPLFSASDNLLLITIDTTRADHLSCYGYPIPTSPNIDRLASEGILFESVTSQIPLTGPAHVSLMTSRHPRSHGAIRNGVPMAPDIPTLAEVLKEQGYTNAAFISGWTLRKKLTGLHRGFALYNDRLDTRYRFVNSERPADQVTDLAKEWLGENRKKDFFLWVHYFDPHFPYRRHKKFSHQSLPVTGKTANGFSREKIARYDSEISFVDHHIGLLLEELRNLGLENRTLVVLTSDHGESFGEHNYVGHGRRVYESILRIPLILRYPGKIPAGLRSDYPSQTIDVMPTVLSLMGIPAPKGMKGRNLETVLQPDLPPAEPEIYFETFAGARKKFWKIFSPPLRGIPLLVGKKVGSWKYIYNPKTGRHELYNLATDPLEEHNRIDEHPEFRSLAQSCLEREEFLPLAARDQQIDPEDRKMLKSLGYVD